MKKADILLRANHIFTAAQKVNGPGFVAVVGGEIAATGAGQGEEWAGEGTDVRELGDSVVCPGFVDAHCFFSGYAMGFVGVDLSAAADTADLLARAKDYAKTLPEGKTVLGHGWDGEKITPPTLEEMDAAFGACPAVLFAQYNEYAAMNTAAIDYYGFEPDKCWSEMVWKLQSEVVKDRDYILPMFEQYMKLQNSNGVTSVKEMGFDDWYGFTNVLEEYEKAGKLKLRVSFMSQPVGHGLDLAHGKAMRDKFAGDFVRFSGYNRMTDGSISEWCGDLKQPYCDKPGVTCAQDIDWPLLEKDTIAVDDEGFRFSLHAQGDGAIGKVLDIYEKCKRDENGRMVNRHSITDLECSDPADLKRMGDMGVVAEVYPQIMSLYDDAKAKLEMVESRVGERGKNYWNRRAMVDNGVVVSCATDLPLLIDNIPESIYHAVGGYFPEGGEPFNPQNTITVEELLTGWTKGGAYCLYTEDKVGTLETGKKADIAVLNANVFDTPMDKVRDVKVSLTLIDGKIVHEA